MTKPCKKHLWGCPYHACMSDHCQRSVVKDQGVEWGPGFCEKPTAINLTSQCNSVQNDTKNCHTLPDQHDTKVHLNVFPE